MRWNPVSTYNQHLKYAIYTTSCLEFEIGDSVTESRSPPSVVATAELSISCFPLSFAIVTVSRMKSLPFKFSTAVGAEADIILYNILICTRQAVK